MYIDHTEKQRIAGAIKFQECGMGALLETVRLKRWISDVFSAHPRPRILCEYGEIGRRLRLKI